MFVSTPAKTEITKGIGRSTGLTSGLLGRPSSLVSLDDRGGLALLMTELKSSYLRATALTLTLAIIFLQSPRGPLSIPEALKAEQQPITTVPNPSAELS